MELDVDEIDQLIDTLNNNDFFKVYYYFVIMFHVNKMVFTLYLLIT
jgi:hypothetical protein